MNGERFGADFGVLRTDRKTGAIVRQVERGVVDGDFGFYIGSFTDGGDARPAWVMVHIPTGTASPYLFWRLRTATGAARYLTAMIGEDRTSTPNAERFLAYFTPAIRSRFRLQADGIIGGPGDNCIKSLRQLN